MKDNLVELLGVEPDVADWNSLAKCRHISPELFFELSEEDDQVMSSVQECCSLCPVQKQCLKAGANGKEYGVWGGVLFDRGVRR